MSIIRLFLSISALALISACGTLGADKEADSAAATGTDCTDCGFIESINIAEGREGIGLSSVLGGAGGGFAGAIGSENGDTSQTAATVAGASSSAISGLQVQRRVGNNSNLYRFSVRMDNGKRQTVALESRSGFEVGDRVKIVDGSMVKTAPGK
ncbi:MAG: hypothetical protein H0V78_08475 [Burkholderiales bacterium]|nr:hypothetical protein [Burkholderiales bacterium]